MLGLMVFAAGLGTRMAPLTATKPKPLIQVAGKPLIDHAIELGNEAGCNPIVVNTRYLADQIQSHLAERPILISHETEPMETGGGLKHAAHHYSDPCIATLNSDAVWLGPNPLQVLENSWDNQFDALLLTAPLDQLWGDDRPGDFDSDAEGNVVRWGNQRYLGAQIIRLETVLAIQESNFSLRLVWEKLLSQGRLGLCPYPGEWCDVGRPENIAIAEKMLENRHV